MSNERRDYPKGSADDWAYSVVIWLLVTFSTTLQELAGGWVIPVVAAVILLFSVAMVWATSREGSQR